MSPEAAPSKTEVKSRSEVRSPIYDLSESVGVADAIHKKGGGVASLAQLAAFLSYKGVNNGAFLSRVASAKLFGLVEGKGAGLTISPLAQRVLMPTFPEQTEQALREAWLGIPLFKAVFDEFDGRELPPEFGMKNLFRTRFGIPSARLSLAYKAMMDSADQAGLFRTKGSRTQLIIPSVQRQSGGAATSATDIGNDEAVHGGGNGGGDGGRPRQPIAQTPDDLKNTYLAALIEVWREKSLKGDMDKELMERIEKLLAIKP